MAGFSSTRSLILVYLVNLHYIFLGHFLCDPGLLSHYKSSFCAAKTTKNADNACSVLFWRKAVKIMLKMTIELCTIDRVFDDLTPGEGTPHMKRVGMLVENFELNP